MEEFPNREKDETIASGHLAEGFRPIMASVGTRDQHGEELAVTKNIEKTGKNVDFNANERELDNGGFKHDGYQTYVISPVDSQSKFTRSLHNCTSLVAVGRGAESELSLMTHQEPSKFLGEAKDSFTRDLKNSLAELKVKCSGGSIDIVLAGGHFYSGDPQSRSDNYQESIEILSSIVQEVMGFKPLVVCGPKDSNSDYIHFDTEKRRLYIVRHDDAVLYNDAFKPGDVGKMQEKWDKEN